MGRKPHKNLNLPPRMRARTQRSGKVYYYYDKGGKPRVELPLGDDFVEAVKQWSILETDQGLPHKELITFRYAAERYMKEVLPTKAPRTQKDNLTELKQLYKFFDDPPAPINDIQPIHIRQYLDSRKSAPVRANREKALFSHIFNKAREWGMTDKTNPCQGVKSFKEDGRDHYIDDVVFQCIWDCADSATRDAMDMAYLTGQRPADVLKMSEADIKDGRIAITQNKTGKKIRVEITGELKQLIERIQSRKQSIEKSKVRSLSLLVKDDGQPLNASTLDSRFERARARAAQKAIMNNDEALSAQIMKSQFRDLRAKAGTDKEESQGMAAAKDQLGHANESMTNQYVRHRIGKIVKPTK